MPALIAHVLAVALKTRSEIRWRLAGLAIGFILLSVGLAAIAVFVFSWHDRRSSTDREHVKDDDITLLVLDFLPTP
jgi:hypothetical protein